MSGWNDANEGLCGACGRDGSSTSVSSGLPMAPEIDSISAKFII